MKISAKALTGKMLSSITLTAVAAFSTLSFLAFKEKLYSDFLGQLGIAKEQANDKITTGFLHGYLDHYSIRNLKNIATGDRTAIVKDVAAYAKHYVATDDFKKAYGEMKQRNKPPAMQKVQTPEEMRAELIKSAKESIQSMNESIKKATPGLKPIFEQTLAYAKKSLKDAEDPNNAMIKSYTQNFAFMKKMMEENHQRLIGEWEVKYPDNYMPMIKDRLQEFLAITEDVDFAAPTKESRGKRYFVNAAYERKSNQWKMAYRVGKEPVEAARTFAQQWINEIK